MSLLLLRFKLTPREDCASGEADPSIVPVTPKGGMYMRVD